MIPGPRRLGVRVAEGVQAGTSLRTEQEVARSERLLPLEIANDGVSVPSTSQGASANGFWRSIRSYLRGPTALPKRDTSVDGLLSGQA